MQIQCQLQNQDQGHFVILALSSSAVLKDARTVLVQYSIIISNIFEKLAFLLILRTEISFELTELFCEVKKRVSKNLMMTVLPTN
jgi:hypothetical protein